MGGLFLVEMFAFEAVGVAEHLVEAVADTMKGKIPGAGVIDFVAAEGFFVLSEAVPGVMRVARSGDAPEVEGVGAVVFGVDNHLDEQDCASHEFFIFASGSGVSVVAGAVEIVDEAGGDGLLLELGDIESGEAGFELILEVFLVLGCEMIAITDILQEGSEDLGFFRLGSGVDGEAFFLMIAPVADFGLLDAVEDGGFVLTEIDDPGMSGLDVMGFDETKLLHFQLGDR